MKKNLALSNHYKNHQSYIKKIAFTIKKVQDNNFQIPLGFFDMVQLEIIKIMINQTPGIEVELLDYFKLEEKYFVVLYTDKYIDNDYVTMIEMKYPIRYQTITHQQVLGTILNSGFISEDIGDIILNDDGVINLLFITTKINELCYSITKINNVPVKLKIIKNQSVEIIKKQTRQIIITSLRIDNVIVPLIRGSRTKAKYKIDKQEVFINHECITSLCRKIKIDDVISIRKIGRFKILKIVENKKGKFIVTIR